MLVGKGTTIGEKTHITQSTIGANCKIGIFTIIVISFGFGFQDFMLANLVNLLIK